MILKIETLKDVANKLVNAVDANELSQVTETLELQAADKMLTVSVTNQEYFVEVNTPIDVEENFHATVNANLFLKLVSQTTSDIIDLTMNDNYLLMKGNGVYKLPLIFDKDELLVLPRIYIGEVTSEMDVSTEVLHSILNYNSKELTKLIQSSPLVQRFYYLDENGCVTFTTGACVNNFKLDQPIKVLLNSRLVKLFKLLKGNTTHLSLGHRAISADVIQTIIRLECDGVTITSILTCDDTLVTKVPADIIRERALKTYDYSVNMNRDVLIQAINRLLLFSSGIADKENLKPYGTFEFGRNSVTIYDTRKDNHEVIYYNNDTNIDNYTAMLDLYDIKNTLDTCSESYLNFSFGDGQAIVIGRNNVYNVIPECTTI